VFTLFGWQLGSNPNGTPTANKSTQKSIGSKRKPNAKLADPGMADRVTPMNHKFTYLFILRDFDCVAQKTTCDTRVRGVKYRYHNQYQCVSSGVKFAKYPRN
jgi:hypothetical protein